MKLRIKVYGFDPDEDEEGFGGFDPKTCPIKELIFYHVDAVAFIQIDKYDFGVLVVGGINYITPYSQDTLESMVDKAMLSEFILIQN